jgi:hypothetical protein
MPLKMRKGEEWRKIENAQKRKKKKNWTYKMWKWKNG